MKTIHDELSNAAGNADQAKVLQLCPSWAKPMKDGIPCTVFRRELEAACPELPAFLSKAGNQSHEVHSKETKVQLMLALSQHFVSLNRTMSADSAQSAAPAPTAEVTWDRVVNDIASMKPHFGECAKECADFVAAFGGGEDAPHLHEAEAFAKQLKARREPEKGQLALLARAQMQRQSPWIIACLK